MVTNLNFENIQQPIFYPISKIRIFLHSPSKLVCEEQARIFSLPLSHMCQCVDLPPVTRLLHLGGPSPTVNPSHLPSLFKHCNSVFQTLLCSEAYFSRFSCLFSLLSSRSRGNLWFLGQKSIQVVFLVKKWSFSLQDPTFLVFFGFSEACLS